MEELKDIGFYTLSNERAKNCSSTSPMWRCELIITDRCNFQCPYCRGLRPDCKGEMSTSRAIEITNLWASQGLKNIRYSGGEPTIHNGLIDIVKNAKEKGIERIALSTNGSAWHSDYMNLIDAGVNDFSISLDACCSSFADEMAGVSGYFQKVVNNIINISKRTYTTVGVVLTETNVDKVNDIIQFAHELGVADIRIISAAQYNQLLSCVCKISEEILDAHPILKYRVDNIKKGRNVRGISDSDCSRCFLTMDDSVIAGDYHFPCIIHMREGGNPIGRVDSSMREDRLIWSENHNCFQDEICRKNCLDVCIDYNNKCLMLKNQIEEED